MPDIYTFRAEDIPIWQEIARRVMGEHNRPRGGRHDQNEQPPQAPDVHIARIPEGGIEGIVEGGTGTGTDTVPEVDYGDCPIYRLQNANPGASGTVSAVSLGLTERVYNPLTSRVKGNEWVIVARVRHGQWVIIGRSGTEQEPGTAEGGDGYCSLASLRPGDCVLVRTGTGESEQLFKLLYDGTGHWTSEETFVYPAGGGVFDFFFDAGRLRLKLAGLDLLNCGDGCFSGGPLTGHDNDEGDASGTGTSFDPCTGSVFTVCVECTCCEEPAWYCVNLGSGCVPVYLNEEDVCDPDIRAGICSGPYATLEDAEEDCGPPPGPVTTTCCSGTPIAGEIACNITNGGPPTNCDPCATGANTFTHNGTLWVSETRICNALPIHFTLECTGTQFVAKAYCNGVLTNTSAAVTPTSCTPTFSLTIPLSVSGSCCSAISLSLAFTAAAP